MTGSERTVGAAVARLTALTARAVLVTSMCGACGDDGDAGDGAGAGSAGGPGSAGMGAMAPVSYAAEVQPLFELACSCHTGPNFMQLGAPFSLEASVAYGNIVSAPSQQVPGMLLVSPGSLNDSYLWLKVQGTQAEVGGAGQTMPPNVPLDTLDKDLLARWIAGGAQP
jgi:hypothetical protein